MVSGWPHIIKMLLIWLYVTDFQVIWTFGTVGPIPMLLSEMPAHVLVM